MKKFLSSLLFLLFSLSLFSQKTVDFEKVTGGVTLTVNGSATKFSTPVAVFNCTSTSFSARINDQVFVFKTSDAITVNGVVMTTQTGCDITDLLQTTVFNVTTGGGGGGATSKITTTNNAGSSGDVQRTNDQLKTSDSAEQAATAALIAKLPSLGPNTMANSQPTVPSTDFVMTSVTGQSAQTATVNNILTTTSGTAATDVSNFRSATIQIVSTASGGTFIFEGSNDNVTFYTLPFYLTGFNPAPLATAANASGGSNLYHLALPVKYFRCRIATTITGGSIQAFTTYFSNPLSTTTLAAGNGGTSGMNVRTTENQATVAAADAKANPTAGMWLDAPFKFNGTTWDREHGNWNTTTTDAGAKVAAGNGATQVNYDSRGAEITVLFSAVSGTFTTMQFQLQYSFDGGTNWKNFGPATTNNTSPTSTDTYTFIVYPTNTSQAAGVTPANLTTSSTQTVAINAALPRTWRITWNVAGSSPSVTITGVYVNYQL